MNGIAVAPIQSETDALNLVFSALSDPIRREILAFLDGDELKVGEIADRFDISVQAISRHLKVLVRAGLVSQEREGRISRCRLDAGPIFAAAVWMNQYSKYWQSQFEALVAFLPEMDGGQEGR